jgi:dolichol-phosphate mannosyltransferase
MRFRLGNHLQSNQACLVVPTFNERDNLPLLLEAIAEQPLQITVLVVDDNSPDGTGQIAEALRSRYPNLDVLHRTEKLGLGTAYLAGIRWALDRRYSHILTMDSDFSHHPRYLPDMLRLGASVDVSIGSRYVPGGGTVNWPLKRRLLSRTANLLARAVTGAKASDLTAGFRCYRRELLEAIDLDHFRCKGYAFLIEMAFRCHLAGARFGETPIVFQDREHGLTKISSKELRMALRLLADIFKFRLGLISEF